MKVTIDHAAELVTALAEDQIDSGRGENMALNSFPSLCLEVDFDRLEVRVKSEDGSVDGRVRLDEFICELIQHAQQDAARPAETSFLERENRKGGL